MRKSFERRVSRMAKQKLHDLLDRSYQRANYRIVEIVEAEQDRRREDAELNGGPDAYDATDDCYLYDRHNPMSPWAY